MVKADGPFHGRMAEEWIEEEYKLDLFRQDYYDLKERGVPAKNSTLYQAKAASVTVQNPKGERSGRFQLNYPDHLKLARGGHSYIFLLIDPSASNPVVAHTEIEATEVTKLLKEYKWAGEQQQKKIPWYVVFPEQADEYGFSEQVA